jgi:hypothetical protein
MRAKMINESYYSKKDLEFTSIVKSSNVSLYNLQLWDKLSKFNKDFDYNASLNVDWTLELNIKKQGVSGLIPIVDRVYGIINIDENDIQFDSYENKFEIKVNTDNIFMMIEIKDIAIDFKNKIININF